MSRAKTEAVSPDRAQLHKTKNLKQRGELFKIPKGYSDVKSDFSETESPIKPSGIQYENTFKMTPDDDKRFVAFKIENAIKDILKKALEDQTYSAELCSKQTQDLCAKIKEKTKQMALPRYKLVVQVLMGQDTDQSVQMASRCLWDHNNDNFAAATYRNSSLYAIATVYGLYME